MGLFNYTGKIYGKYGKRYVPLLMTAEEVDRIQAQRDELLEAIKAFRDAKGRYHTQKAAEKLLALIPASSPSH